MAAMSFKHFLIAAFFVLILGPCAAGSISAEGSRMLLDQVPVFPGFKPATALKANEHGDQQVALTKALEKQWNGRYRITAKRFYIYRKYESHTFPLWLAFEKYVDNYFRDEAGGEREYHEVTPTPEPVATVWKLDHRRFAIAESMVPLPDGSALCGYFEVEKE
jgi:hypothetical protein